jgi:hypothetical protein
MLPAPSEAMLEAMGYSADRLDRSRRNNPTFYAWRPWAGAARAGLAATAATPPARVASTDQ